jgi:uncharacterized membrane protein
MSEKNSSSQEAIGFEIEEALSFGWKATKENLGFLIGTILLFWIICFVPVIFATIWWKNNGQGFALSPESITYFVFRIVFWVLQAVMMMGLLKIILKLIDKGVPKIGDLFSCFHLFPRYFFSSILYLLIILGGLILLIIPGIIFAIKYQFYLYFIVDKGQGAIDALKKSSQITKDVKLKLFLFGLVLIFINIAGLLCLLVGVLVSAPLTLISLAYVYRKLLAQVETPVISQPAQA